MPTPMPTVEQVLELPALMEKLIPPEWQDLNGHVNVRHYL
jgi:acyl-CoA thioester hydrolase